MYIYAQINEENICTGVSDLSGEVKSKNLIAIDAFDATLIGKKYEQGKWIEIEKREEPESEDHITETDSILLALADVYELISKGEKK